MFFAPGHYRAAFVVPVPEPLLNATLIASFSTNDSHNLEKMLFNRVHNIGVIYLKFKKTQTAITFFISAKDQGGRIV